MFTGIITDIGVIRETQQRGDLRARIATNYKTSGIDLGASIACDGVCLTVIELGADWFDVEISAETVSKTNIGTKGWPNGRRLNLERALKVGDELGGHIVSGHVFGCIEVLEVEQDELNMRIVFERPANLRPYLLNKGFVALNGCSLTIAEVTAETFTVCLIPETRDVTIFGQTKVGDKVNLEIDPSTQATVDTIKELMASGQLAELIATVKNA